MHAKVMFKKQSDIKNKKRSHFPMKIPGNQNFQIYFLESISRTRNEDTLPYKNIYDIVQSLIKTTHDPNVVVGLEVEYIPLD